MPLNHIDFEKKELLEGIYFRQPVWLQNVSFSAYGLLLRRRRHGKFFRKKLEELKESDWWTVDEISSYHEATLPNVIKQAYENVPYYRNLFKSHKLVPDDIRTISDLRKIPLLKKSQVRANQGDMLDRRFPKKELSSVTTSGTTGSPITVYLSSEGLQFQWAVRWRHKARFGLRLGDKSLMLGARLPVPIKQNKPPYWRHNRAINNTYLSTYLLTPETMPHVIDWLNSEDLDYYTGYPSAMYVLARFMKSSGNRLLNRPKYTVTGAETLLPVFEQTIQAVFGTMVTDQYGMAEACGNFSMCELGRFHLDSEFCIVELLPIKGLEHTRLRRLVFTGLTNPAMPFIRYDIGDYGIMAEGPCECGRQSLSIEAIDGRVDDYVRTPAGQMVIGLGQVLQWTSGVDQTQIIQNKINEVDFLIVPSRSYNKDRDQLILEKELRKRVGNSLKINFQVVDSIPLTKSGKYRAVESNLSPSSEGERQIQLATRSGIIGMV